MILTLSGFMGSGKSSTARALAARTGWPSLDLDEVVGKKEGCSIPEIFARGGEKSFRNAERRCLEDLLAGEDHRAGNLILALGGGTLTTPKCRTLIRRHACNIYLRASRETLLGNLAGTQGERPLLDGAPLSERIDTLLSSRSGLYEAAADHIVDIDGLSPDAVAERILALLTPGK